MPKTTSSATEPAEVAPSGPVTYESLLSRLGARDRLNVERHVTACETEETPAHAKLWKRIACALAGLAPHSLQTVGQQAVQFFVADGKYRMQVFAMEDPGEGKLLIYCVDVLRKAIKKGILKAASGKTEGDVHLHVIVSDVRQMLEIESLDAANTPNPAPFFKHMLGWNRKALRITLPTTASPAQIAAAEAICALAADE